VAIYNEGDLASVRKEDKQQARSNYESFREATLAMIEPRRLRLPIHLTDKS
jgi:hypothetical protein